MIGQSNGRFALRRQVHDELGKLVGVAGAFGFVGHAHKMALGGPLRNLASRVHELSDFKLTHYRGVRGYCEAVACRSSKSNP